MLADQLRLSEQAYWEGLYDGVALPRAFDAADRGLRNSLRLYLMGEIDRGWAQCAIRPGGRLLEIGCGASFLLPAIARRHAMYVEGMDYSPSGCVAARAMLARDGVEGIVHQADLFDPPADLLGAFDLVTSFGVMEHFVDTALALVAGAALLRPGGVQVVSVPNLAGFNGAGLRRWRRDLFDIHVAFDADGLAHAHRRAGLEVIATHYVCPFYPFDFLTHLPASSGLKGMGIRALRNGALAISAAAWELDRALGGRWAAGRRWSPWLFCWSRKP
jgi:2-polyprenyl-3-methyl-5-hydroxy-6-metoxy-1,4-benzoquinol methylase